MALLRLSQVRNPYHKRAREPQKNQTQNATNMHFLLNQLVPLLAIYRKLFPSLWWVWHYKPQRCTLMHTFVHKLHHQPRLSWSHGTFVLQGNAAHWRPSDLKNTKAHCYVSSMPNHSSQEAVRVYESNPNIAGHETVYGITEMKIWRLTQRNKNTRIVHMGGPSPGQQHATQGLSTRSPELTPAGPNFPKT